MTSKNYTVEQINNFYAERHKIRPGIFGEKPYANYGYWTREGMTIDEACDSLTDLMAKELELNRGDRLLECGCGYGASAIYLAKNYQPEKIVGRDVSDIRIELGRELIKKNNLEDRVEIGFGDATHLEFESESFTKIVAIECAFHFNTRKDFFHEAFRLLKPGGLLVMTDIMPSPDINLADYTLEQIREFLSADVRMYADDNIYDWNRYERYLKEAGFAPVKIYSIKDRVVLQFADHLENAEVERPDIREKKARYAKAFRELLMVLGDYIVVRAQKPKC